ncbi:MAG TPA: class I SAM-dependent methyltransferase [Thermoanaerobaculia bacterium]|nr:class I SAM-dependent methyltransferase [Thermoanaerobaculia bacterium]HMF10590.1 class I SAM-dependent methyltransferase [Thermoanaerobaculia bacterium]
MHRKYGLLKSRLLGSVPNTVVELGPGAGANMRYLPPGTRLIAFEPNVRMHSRLRSRAERFRLNLDLRTSGAEALDIPDRSVDLVCVTLVLCSVSDPARVLSEVRRVLQPGGRFVCIEHVPAQQGSGLRRLQHVVASPWQWVFEGCNLLNQTEALIASAGFQNIEVQRLGIPTAFFPIRSQISAVCTV